MASSPISSDGGRHFGSELQAKHRARAELFGQSSDLLSWAEKVLPRLLQHNYSFIDDESLDEWRNSASFNVGELNRIVALDVIEKAHLVAVTSLIRTMRWADGICLSYVNSNFVVFAASMRGLLESAGDIVQGVVNTPSDSIVNVTLTIAQYHKKFRRALTGQIKDREWHLSELQKALGHFIHGKWMRTAKSNPTQTYLKAKDNIEYVRNLAGKIPNVESLYHRLCAVAHPSSASIDYHFDLDQVESMRLNPEADLDAIKHITGEFPNALPSAIQHSINPTLWLLIVLHKFEHHPQLPELKGIIWSNKTWEKIKLYLA